MGPGSSITSAAAVEPPSRHVAGVAAALLLLLAAAFSPLTMTISVVKHAAHRGFPGAEEVQEGGPLLASYPPAVPAGGGSGAAFVHVALKHPFYYHVLRCVWGGSGQATGWGQR